MNNLVIKKTIIGIIGLYIGVFTMGQPAKTIGKSFSKASNNASSISRVSTKSSDSMLPSTRSLNATGSSTATTRGTSSTFNNASTNGNTNGIGQGSFARVTPQGPQNNIAEIKTRPTPGKDGGISKHIIEKDRPSGDVVSRTHSVKVQNKTVHQHQEHMGKHGGERRFSDQWTGTRTINATAHKPLPSKSNSITKKSK